MEQLSGSSLATFDLLDSGPLGRGERKRLLAEGLTPEIYVLAGGLGLVGVLWLGGAMSALLVGHRVGRDTVFAGLAAFDHMGDPSRAWHVPVGPAPLYWSVTCSALLLAMALIVAIARLVSAESRRKGDDPTSIVGLADRRQVRAVAGATALLARASTLRPSVLHPVPADVGFSLGTANGVECWSSVEDSMIVLGPPRSERPTSHRCTPAATDASWVEIARTSDAAGGTPTHDCGWRRRIVQTEARGLIRTFH